LLKRFVQFSNREFCLSSRGHVVEQDRYPVLVWRTGAECMHVVPAPQRFGEVLEACRFASERYFAVAVEPVAPEVGRDLAHPLASSTNKACLQLESRIDLDEAVIDRAALVIKLELDDAEANVDGFEERAVAIFTADQFRASTREFLLPTALLRLVSRNLHKALLCACLTFRQRSHVANHEHE